MKAEAFSSRAPPLITKSRLSISSFAVFINLNFFGIVLQVPVVKDYICERCPSVSMKTHHRRMEIPEMSVKFIVAWITYPVTPITQRPQLIPSCIWDSNSTEPSKVCLGDCLPHLITGVEFSSLSACLSFTCTGLTL